MSRTRIMLHCLLIMVLLCFTTTRNTVNIVPAGVSQLTRKFYPLGDALVFEGDANRNFGSHGEIGVNHRNGYRYRSFIIFNLSSVPPGSTIVSANLNLYMYDPPNSSRVLECYLVAEPWKEFEVTWKNQPKATLFVASTKTGTMPKMLSLNVKSSVANFTCKDYFDYMPNYGWMLKDSVESPDLVGDPYMFWSRECDEQNKRPYLEVKYYPPCLELSLSSNSIKAGEWVRITVYRKTYNGEPVTRGDLKVKLFSNSTSNSKRFSLTEGGSAITELTIPDDYDSMDFYYYDEKTGIWSITATAGDYADYVGDSKVLKVNPSKLGAFAFNAISSPKTVAVPFPITITAYDIYGNVKTDYTGQNLLSDTTGTISPNKTGVFVKGKWVGNVSISRIGSNIRIATSGEDKSGESNPFNITAGPPAKLVIEPSSLTVAVNIPYSYLRISLRDANGFETTNSSDIIVNLSTTSLTGSFRKPETIDPVVSIKIPAGENSVNLDYYDTEIGVRTLMAWATGLTPGTAIATVMLDIAPPLTTIAVDYPKHQLNETLCVSNSTVLTISASDDLSGVREVRYKIDEEQWNIYESTALSFTLSNYSDGLHTIWYYSIDKAGNRENEKKFSVTLDRVPPKIEEASPSGKLFLGSLSVIFTVKAVDFSGIREIELFIDGVSQGNMSIVKSKHTKNVNVSEGIHNWSVKIIDNVGNSAMYNYSFTLALDTTPPQIIVLSEFLGPVFGESSTLTCEVYDSYSGVKSVYLYYSTDGGASWEVTPMILDEGVYKGSVPSQMLFAKIKYYVEAMDKAGNRAKTNISECTVGIPAWLYLTIIAIIVVPIAVFLFRSFKKKSTPQET